MSVSKTTQQLIELLTARDAAGRTKYGATLDRGDLTHAEWLQHMVEELLDAAGYALAAKREMLIPDGFVLVPVEPTEEMITNGFSSFPSRPFTPLEEWEMYEEMSGCQQAAYRAKKCWAAMIAARPQGVGE